MSNTNDTTGKINFSDKIADAIMPVAEKLQSFNFIGALSETMQVNLPITIIGSFACLFAFLDLGGWQQFLADNPSLTFVFMNIQSLTLSIFAFYVMLTLPYLYAIRLDMGEALGTIPLTLGAFFLLTPTDLYTSIPTEWLGHKGLISAILVSFVVVRILKFCLDKKIRIKMPPGVPKFVENGFALLVPAAIILVLCSVIGHLVSKTSLGTIHNIIYNLLQTPFQKVGLSMIGQAITETCASLLMFCGIHAMTIVGVVEPIRMVASLENLQAWQTGLALPNIVTNGFTSLSLIGAGGNCLIATLSVLLFAKSNRYKSIGRIALVPGLFGIGEPILFGLPIMLNPMLFIPFIAVNFLNQIIAYVVIAVGLVGRFTGVTLSWTVPPILNVILGSSTPVRAVIAQIVIIIIDLAIWYPFIKASDKLALEEEALTETT